MHRSFTLVLMVNHACPLRCSYCYTGAKVHRPMPEPVARAAIDRALASLGSCGRLDLGFFGGEPLLEARLIASVLAYAQERAAAGGFALSASLTTSGMCADPAAWSVMTHPLVELSVSHDGLPAVHDRHRRTVEGGGTSAAVERALRRLVDAGRDVNVVMVLRPDTVERMSEGIAHLRGLGIRRVEPSIDLWTGWSRDDFGRLRRSIAECARLWRKGLPTFGISWFDEALARIAGVPLDADARCRFGDGQIAVAPSGRLYPCERLIGEDPPVSPVSLAGSALEGADFLSCGPGPCVGGCPCSNYVRTGQPGRADELLRTLESACREEVLRVLEEGVPA